MSWGKVDYSQLKRVLDKLQKAQQEDFLKGLTRNLGLRLYAKVKKRTPVKSSYMKVDGWSIGEVNNKGTLYSIEIINSAPYASYVDLGHSQEVGRYVPAIGKRLKRPFVPGLYITKRSEEELERESSAILDQEMRKFMERVFSP